jgi:hypothetical protein
MLYSMPFVYSSLYQKFISQKQLVVKRILGKKEKSGGRAKIDCGMIAGSVGVFAT